jgi:hypothetical protein
VSIQAAVMKIIWVETPHPLELPHVRNRKLLPFKGDQPATPESLDRPVDMHRSKPGRISYVGLRRRKVAGKAMREANRLQAKEHLANEVRDAFLGGALSNVDNPLAVNGFAHKLLPPERGCYVRVSRDDAVENLPANLGDPELRYRSDPVVHPIEDEQVEVAKVAGNSKIDNLAAAIMQRSIVAGTTLQDQE